MSAAHFLRIDIAGIEPEKGTPAPDRVISGNPKF
jgi:hypothetical protein